MPQPIQPWSSAQSQRQFARCKALSVSLALLAFSIGFAALLGWIFDIEFLKRIHPSLVTMKANTAVCLMLIAVAVWLLQDRLASPFKRRLACLFAALVAIVGLTTLSEHLFGWDLHIDQLLFQESAAEAGQSFPGRMGVAGSLDFFFLGASLFFLDATRRRWFRLSNISVLTVVVITLLVFLYYFYGIEKVEAIALYFTIALHTVVALFGLCAAILLMRPERGVMSLLLGSSPGSLIARRMWPALLIVVLLGWIRNLGVQGGYYGPGFGTAAFVVAILLLLVGLVWWIAATLNRTDNQRREADLSLSESESRLVALLEQLPVGIGLTDRDGKFLIRNSRLNEFVGEMIPSLDPVYRQRWRGWNEKGLLLDASEWPSAKALRGETATPSEMLYTNENGQRIWTRVASVPFRDETDDVGGVIIVVQETDEQKRAAAERARLAAIVDSSDDAIIGKDLEGTIVSWNAGAQRIFGYTADEVIGKSITILMPPDRLAEEPEILRRIRQGDRIEHFETVRRRKDGSLLDISLTVSPIFDQRGKPIGVSKIARDITQRKQAESRLYVMAQVGDLIRTLQNPIELSYAVAMMLGAHLDVRRCLFNETDLKRDVEVVHRDYCDRAESVAGDHRISDYSSITSAEMARGLTVVNYDSKTDPRTAADYERTYKTTGERAYIAVPLMRDGHWIASFWASDDHPRQWSKEQVLLLETVGERTWSAIEKLRAQAERERLFRSEQEARDAAERANKIKDDFLATLSHELRNPLNVILGYSELLLRMPELEDSQRLRQMGMALRRNAQSQSQLINDLLDLSRLQRGKISLSREAVSLAAIIDSAIETVQSEANAKKIEIQSKIDDPLLFVEGDRLRLQQIAWNVLNNAVKFTPEGGAISITLRGDAHKAVLVIEDSGQGIDPSFLPNVFEMFRQADSSNSRRHGGMGIGLALVRQLVELHGGTIIAESEGANQGSRFTIWLPLIREMKVSASGLPESTPVELNVPPNANFLIVDDSCDTLIMLEQLLKIGGANVTTANSGAEALRIATEKEFDMILSDISMPEMDGYELLRRLRQIKGREDVPVVAITGFGKSDDVNRARTAGFYSHLTKPLSLEALSGVLQQFSEERLNRSGSDSAHGHEPAFDHDLIG
jgi:PAS domain S-box-containing protein